MAIETRLQRTNKKQATKRAKAHDARLLAKAERETREGLAPPSPAAVLKEAKAEAEAAMRMPIATNGQALASVERLARSNDALAKLSVPMTLSEVCEVIGRDCKPEKFSSTALETLAGQLDGLTTIADANEGVGTYDQWRVVDNVVARMRLAANVAAWLESESPEAAAKLPQVQP